jgi:hypothetical protein
MKNYWDDKIKEDEMDGVCSTHRAEKRDAYNGLAENLEEGEHLQDLDLDRGIIHLILSPILSLNLNTLYSCKL